ncbi:YdeI/OmpD-associated family protein [Bradyrhizobium australafricanum]|uniref:YdeI/OmpD-associated family protein n=1 Tax=Bradyrhizobium australafricanum TaxID=2821406 RepID=UPI001CE2D3A8|nr:YdeI/OmpD-associated family protein [Bradyrhizobium australafricanum]MCA6101660.1 YdeI/OmpD-associated family protein [Bradyrhizobium australafricanum]
MTLKRPRAAMPASIRHELDATGLMQAFKARPPYQRNDYLHLIGRSVRTATRRKRIDQMLAELKAGGVYMGMAHRPSKPK